MRARSYDVHWIPLGMSTPAYERSLGTRVYVRYGSLSCWRRDCLRYLSRARIRFDYSSTVPRYYPVGSKLARPAVRRSSP